MQQQAAAQISYTLGQVPHCPHCGKTLEDPVEDHVIPGRIGERSRSRGDCGWCDGLFDVERASDTEFVLTPRTGKR